VLGPAMCRMLACLTADGLPDGLVTRFQRLSHEGMVPPRAAPGHVSGWGAYASNFETTTLHYRSSKDAYDDPSFQAISEAVGRISGPRALMFHLRKASVGAKRVVNSHPFVVGGRAFMHNGSVKGLANSISTSREPLGQTDSEVYFLMLLDSLEGRRVRDAVRETISRLEHMDYTSLTFVMQDGPSIYAYRHFGRYGDYYTLYYSQERDSVIFCSEPLLGLRWKLIGNRELVHATFDGGRAVVERYPDVLTS